MFGLHSTRSPDRFTFYMCSLPTVCACLSLLATACYPQPVSLSLPALVCSPGLQSQALQAPSFPSGLKVTWSLLKMKTAAFTCGLLLLIFNPVAPTCMPTDFTLYVEKPECDFCVAINTTICVGFCYSRDSNMRDIFGSRFLIQRGCTYQRVEYRTAQLPGCPLPINAAFTYPVALSCHCGACRTDSDQCAHRAGGGGARCSKAVRHMFTDTDSLMLPL
ncbi:thyroid stimulating hormone subunit beta a isoform X2 [Nerophis ophidion]|uniref:thyroid stimulating hormone subunit beta a isoform X2 n=1 Tax=Nerophis ophidion TaxID=159077 RepID=UPI002ADFDC80|nr:thyroid stimulating hormone subunit beta a isoform X2 [Nerophis ophidion]